MIDSMELLYRRSNVPHDAVQAQYGRRLARSIEGALAGSIVAVELYKRSAQITVRTGARFALPLAVGAATSLGWTTSPTEHPRRCRGATTSETASRAIPCSSMRAPPWRLSRPCMLHAR
jgi:hypothetical protein